MKGEGGSNSHSGGKEAEKKPKSVEKIDEDFEFDMTDMNYDNDGYLYSHKVVRKSDINLNLDEIQKINSNGSSISND